MDFNERTKLLIDDEKLAGATVLVFGLGGVGSYTAEALVRMGVGHLIVCDSDTVSISNINRQLIALHSTVGRLKVDVARERYLDINPELDMRTRNSFILPENATDFFDSIGTEVDYVADCIDIVSGKLAIITECRNRGIPVISCMGTGSKLHPELFRIADIKKTSVCPLCRVMRRELRNRGIEKLTVLFSTEEPVKADGTCLNGVGETAGDGLKSGTGETAGGEQDIRTRIDEAGETAGAHGSAAADGKPEKAAGRVIGSIATVPSVAGLMIADFIAKELLK